MTEIKKPTVLVEMLGKSQAKVKIGGEVRTLNNLDLNDIGDLENHLGKSIQDISGPGGLSVEDMKFIIWLGVRKSGLSVNQIDSEEWNTKPRQVGRWFGINKDEVAKAMEIVKLIFEISGFTGENPTPPQAAKDQ